MLLPLEGSFMPVNSAYRMIVAVGMCVVAAVAVAQDDRDLTTAPGRPPRQATFNVSLTPTTAHVLAIGSPIGFSLGATAKGYANLYALSASGKVQLWLENVPIKAGRALSYPSQGVIRATPPGGDEQILLVVTREPFDGFAHGATRSPLVLQHSHSEFRQAVAAKMSRLPRGSWASAELVVRVEDR
jgi:hypothetical protein